MTPTTATCPRCRTKLLETDSFCSLCGLDRRLDRPPIILPDSGECVSTAQATGGNSYLGPAIAVMAGAFVLFQCVWLPVFYHGYKVGRVKVTMAEMRTAGTRFSYALHDDCKSTFDLITPDDYLCALTKSGLAGDPPVDGWGRELMIEFDPDARPIVSNNDQGIVTFTSFGRDGREDIPRSAGPSEGNSCHGYNYDRDLIWTDGAFTTWPGGVSVCTHRYAWLRRLPEIALLLAITWILVGVTFYFRSARGMHSSVGRTVVILAALDLAMVFSFAVLYSGLPSRPWMTLVSGVVLIQAAILKGDATRTNS